MTFRRLTPERLTYYSFRHSQGNSQAQAKILHYIAARHGVEPSFEVTDEVFNHFASFLTGKGARRRHIPADSTDIHLALSEAKEDYDTASGHTITIAKLASTIMMVEVNHFRIMIERDLENPEFERFANRLAIRQLSFLRYHGESRHTTGFQ